MNYIIGTYGIYLLISIILMIWVARTLFKNGRVFLVEIFQGQEELADSVNKLLVVGFYLINGGYVVIALQVMDEITSVQGMVEKLSIKIGSIILILGFMHFFNLFVFYTLRKRSVSKRAQV